MITEKKLDNRSTHRKSIIEKTEEKRNFDEEMKLKRLQKEKDQIDDECTFKPVISKYARSKHNRNNFQEDEVKWLQQKRARDAQRAVEKAEEDCPFKPKILKRRRALDVTSTISNMPIGDRLYQKALQKYQQVTEHSPTARSTTPTPRSPISSPPKPVTPMSKPTSRQQPVIAKTPQMSVTDSNIIKFESDDAFRQSRSNPYSFRPADVNPYAYDADDVPPVMFADDDGDPYSMAPIAKLQTEEIKYEKEEKAGTLSESVPCRAEHEMIDRSRSRCGDQDEDGDQDQDEDGDQDQDEDGDQDQDEDGDGDSVGDEDEDGIRVGIRDGIIDGDEDGDEDGIRDGQSKPKSSSLIESFDDSNEISDVEDDKPETKSAWAEKGQFRRSTIKELFMSLYNEEAE